MQSPLLSPQLEIRPKWLPFYFEMSVFLSANSRVEDAHGRCIGSDQQSEEVH